jgi:hypothetical protein
MRTMSAVLGRPRKHEVRFAMSLTIKRLDYSAGGENNVVVHNAMMHITCKG